MNSLYGRFALRLELQEFKLLNKYEIESFLINKELIVEDVIDIIDTDKSFLLLRKEIHDLNTSNAISAPVTAYTRMKMAPVLLDDSIKVSYTDTDSYVIEGDLETLLNCKYAHLINNDLGELKLENDFSNFIALAPKVYGGILESDSSEIVKVKGFKIKIDFYNLKKLLKNRDTLILNQEKWFKNWENSEIKIKCKNIHLLLMKTKEK